MVDWTYFNHVLPEEPLWIMYRGRGERGVEL